MVGTRSLRYPTGRIVGRFTSWWMRNDSRARCRDLNLGYPTLRPFRSPLIEDNQFFHAWSASMNADWNAYEFTSCHQGHTPSIPLRESPFTRLSFFCTTGLVGPGLWPSFPPRPPARPA